MTGDRMREKCDRECETRDLKTLMLGRLSQMHDRAPQMRDLRSMMSARTRVKDPGIEMMTARRHMTTDLALLPSLGQNRPRVGGSSPYVKSHGNVSLERTVIR